MRALLMMLAMFLIAVSCGVAAAAEKGNAQVQASLVADVDGVVPGKGFTLGIRLKMKEHWHTYWINPGETGEATEVKVSGPEGFEFGAVQWPVPTKLDTQAGLSYGYEDEVVLLVPVRVSKSVSQSGKADLTAEVSWLACKEVCVKGKAKLNISLPVSAEVRPANGEVFEKWRKRVPMAADRAPVSEVLGKVEQATGADGGPMPALAVQWRTVPQKVEWFPASTSAVAIENVVVKHEGASTQIQFKPTIYKADGVPGGRVESVLVYEDMAGRRYGISVLIKVGKGS